MSALTDCVKVPFVNEELAGKIHRTCNFGIWLINNSKDFATACELYSPDIAETRGSIRPAPCEDPELVSARKILVSAKVDFPRFCPPRH